MPYDSLPYDHLSPAERLLAANNWAADFRKQAEYYTENFYTHGHRRADALTKMYGHLAEADQAAAELVRGQA